MKKSRDLPQKTGSKVKPTPYALSVLLPELTGLPGFSKDRPLEVPWETIAEFAIAFAMNPAVFAYPGNATIACHYYAHAPDFFLSIAKAVRDGLYGTKSKQKVMQLWLTLNPELADVPATKIAKKANTTLNRKTGEKFKKGDVDTARYSLKKKDPDPLITFDTRNM